MGIHIILYIYLIFFSSLICANDHFFAGKVLPKALSSFEITSVKQKTEVNAKDLSLFLMPVDKAKKLPAYNENNTYFSNSKNSDEVYSVETSNLDLMILSGTFGSWIKKEFETKDKIKIEYETEYRISSDVKIDLEGEPKTSLLRGSKFHFSKNPYGATVFIHNDGKIKEHFLKEGETLKLQKLFNTRGVIRIGPFSPPKPVFKKAKVAKVKAPSKKTNKSDESKFKSPPTLKTTAEIAKESPKKVETTLSPKLGECNETLTSSGNKPFESCNSSNNHYDKTIAEVLKPTDSHNKNPLKYCILAGLKNTGSDMKLSKCINGKKSDGKHPVCKSKSYVDLVYKELNQQSKCFNNVKLKEIIPLVNVESRFNINAFNYNPGTTKLNASGLLQSTHDVYKSVKPIINLNSKFNLYDSNSLYCKSLLEEMKGDLYAGTTEEKQEAYNEFKKRDLCKRIGNISGIRKNLFLAMGQYSNGKVQANNLINRIESSYLSSGVIFGKDERKKMQIDIARLMHNRGARKIETMLEMFFYDLFRGGDASTLNKKRKVRNGKRGENWLPHYEHYIHGNPKIYKLWGRPGFKAPLNHEAFSKYFSSYLFYEGSRVGIGKIHDNSTGKESQRLTYKNKGPKNSEFIEPDRTLEKGRTDLEIEGGTYLYKIECDQKALTLEAQKLAKKDNFTCDYPSSSKKRLENIRMYTKWYDTCEDKNNGIKSRRKCSSKNPYKAMADGKRRMSDAAISKARQNNHNLKKCDTNSLWGLAANPLTEFYSKEPEVYK